MIMPWIKFWAALLPDLTKLALELYRAFKGDPQAASAELRRIRDHRARYEANRAKNDAIMGAAEPPKE